MAQGSGAPRVGREGSRWFNERPSATEIAEWFKDVPIHEGLVHDRYIGGIVLIEQRLKAQQVTGFNETTGAPLIPESKIEHLTYTPYPKVETRVQYFHDLMALHEDWLGIIEPVGGGQDGMPPGFARRSVEHLDRGGKPVVTRYVTCTMQVRVYEREDFKEQVRELRNLGEVRVIRTGKTIISGPPATKMVPLLDRWGPDDFSMMKAETGAVGRALGMAGMLVVPGAGVASAEDMHEAQALDTTPAVAEAVGAGDDNAAQTGQQQEGEETALRARATELIEDLKAKSPIAFKTFKEWCDEKGYTTLADTNLLQLKGLVKKAEKAIDLIPEQAPE